MTNKIDVWNISLQVVLKHSFENNDKITTLNKSC